MTIYELYSWLFWLFWGIYTLTLLYILTKRNLRSIVQHVVFAMFLLSRAAELFVLINYHNSFVKIGAAISIYFCIFLSISVFIINMTLIFKLDMSNLRAITVRVRKIAILDEFEKIKDFLSGKRLAIAIATIWNVLNVLLFVLAHVDELKQYVFVIGSLFITFTLIGAAILLTYLFRGNPRIPETHRKRISKIEGALMVGAVLNIIPVVSIDAFLTYFLVIQSGYYLAELYVQYQIWDIINRPLRNEPWPVHSSISGI
eukprot:TRINITY_DN5576_c0_g3_i2.p1 TRINITY_DN5576_c0_g3~~TRINITY_DN5576_c0_g3_i2.p1  ORF type:complete len:258 (+),score=26.55 TRINITY_DN5576_c0_g3_i2:123-896(+)